MVPMAIEVKVTANFAKLIGGERSTRAEGGTIGEVLDDLDQRHPGFKQNVVAEGRIHRFVNVYKKGEAKPLRSIRVPVTGNVPS